MKKYSAILIALVLVFSGCSVIQNSRCVRDICINGIGFDGAIERLDAEKTIESYVQEVSGLKKDSEPLLTVAHQFGNYQEYPKCPISFTI